MAEHTVPRAPRPVRTRETRVDRPLLEEIHILTDIDLWALIHAFEGCPPEKKSTALSVVRLAVFYDTAGGPDAWRDYILRWAREGKRGMYHPALVDAPELTWEATAHERALGHHGGL